MDIVEKLIEMYGLETLMLQNDITEYKIVQLMIDEGLIDVQDYIYNEELTDD